MKSAPGAIPVGERDFTDTVIALAQLTGWRVAHFRPCRTERGWRTAVQGSTGFPDLVLARPPRVIFAELKTDKGRLSSEQNAWLIALGWSRDVGIEIWRPRDMEYIRKVLGVAETAP